MAVYVRAHLRRVRVHHPRLLHLAEKVLSAAGESQSELSIELVGDRRMRGLNRRYRKKDRTTDVLAFPMREEKTGFCSALLGDVVISIPTARKQALEAGHTLNDELAALLVHGILHLCGYDHERSANEATRMQRRERAILNQVRPVPSLISDQSWPRRRKR